MTIAVFQSICLYKKDEQIELKKSKSLKGLVSVHFFDMKRLRNGDGHRYTI